MSLRAIKKRDNLVTTTATGPQNRPSIFKKSPRKFGQKLEINGFCGATQSNIDNTIINTASTLSSLHNLQQQRALLGRKVHSNPDLRHPAETLGFLVTRRLVRTRSESDIGALFKSCTGNAADTKGRGLIGAKSEVCLQTISSHNYQQGPSTSSVEPRNNKVANNMISGARSHRDLTQSSYVVSSYDSGQVTSPRSRRRMSECSLASSSVGGYSQRTSAMSASALTLASSGVPIDPNTVLRVPIIGYEVMEERARFTVYKLRVENPHTNDCWLVLRRYTDFVRLNTKLKQSFPFTTLMLPRKKIFGDNFNSVFLDNRVQGLQMFVNSVMANEELRKCKLVREFFCLDEPPTYSESMEECRAIFEAQEETIAHLKLQINSKNDLILNLQQKLRDEMHEKEQMREALKNMSTARMQNK